MEKTTFERMREAEQELKDVNTRLWWILSNQTELRARRDQAKGVRLKAIRAELKEIRIQREEVKAEKKALEKEVKELKAAWNAELEDWENDRS